MYDHSKQYRCEIIRGKSQKEMDDLLPAYAKVVDEICPCSQDDFESLFNNAFARFIPKNDQTKKTFDNHRTEISGKLFGMYFFADDGKVYESERTMKYLEDNDQPAFFKDICYKMQFPNGMQKTKPTVTTRIEDGICVRPLAFVLKLLQIAQTAKIEITKKTIAYYVLNSLDVLQGSATPYEVIDVIAEDRKHGLIRQIRAKDDEGKEKASSYKYQHINEQLNYLELANLIRFTEYTPDRNDKRVILNPNETAAIELFAVKWNEKPDFDVYSYDLSTVESRAGFQIAWDTYYAKLSDCAGQFTTSAESLMVQDVDTDTPPKVKTQQGGTNLVEFGDEGEELVFNYEKARVGAFNAHLVNKVLWLGKTRGLGYDIQSVIAEVGDMSEWVKYIEVKSTKRLTVPDVNDALWIDTLNITRNEYVAAQQHKEFYSIFRVYYTRAGVSVFVITNIAAKLNDGTMQATPMTYRVDFSNTCVDQVLAM